MEHGKDAEAESNAPVRNEMESKAGCLRLFYGYVEDYLDDHKERAYKSAFEQPARFYYNCATMGCGNHVNVHVNWYLALSMQGLDTGTSSP